ncbi:MULTISPECIES: NAD(P)/FAD-dependent oxidoreductase [unclassified Roseitalea]|uniref:flavin-containing monooxygenase n=1 Tax=unclassified Roseitalea TaxID=2639107 RepID=UPI00273DE35C|nr:MULTISPECIES: NAD(P)/FAD-dependent oxidoreductase [unclassified Roseitalea]
MAGADIAAVTALFAQTCYWRDLLSFTWNIRTMEGRAAIADMLEATLAGTAPRNWRLRSGARERDGFVEAWFDFDTAAARCQGMMRLRGGLCVSLFTAMDALAGHEEPTGARRPKGVKHGAFANRRTWLEERQDEARRLGYSEQPYCVIVGGGQGGIALGARLRMLGVPTIIVERNARAGDSWRHRYRSLVLHDPVWYDHLPYIPFPDHWPVFAPKDKLADWLEMYVRVMELNYWTGATCRSAQYDAARGEWTVKVEREGAPVTLRPRQIVFATGVYGPPRMIDLPGADTFGGTFIHSSQYRDGADFAGRRCVVIGAASSAHDVAGNLWEAGAQVTMVQRSPTTVVRSETLMELGFADYSQEALERGLTHEMADLQAASMPYAMLPPGQRALCDRIRQRDAAFYEGLAAAGFAVDFGEDETGLMMKAYRTGSGYYIDVGTSDLIIRGEIAVRSGVAVERLTPGGVVLSDGGELDADVVIACTGYHMLQETIAELVSRDVAERIGPVWGLGSGVAGDRGPWKGELRNMWKPTAQPDLWIHGGNLALSRFYSRFVALQIKARMEGIPTPVHGAPG